MIKKCDGESRNLWEVVGGLRENVQRLIEGQQKLEDRLERGVADSNARVERVEDRLERGLKEDRERLDRKFDRLLYTVIGIGGAIIALLITGIVSG